MVHIWHLTADAPRLPHRVSPNERVTLVIGTWPVESGQRVVVTQKRESASGIKEERQIEARWHENRGSNSYWRAEMGPFRRGDKVSFAINGSSNQGVTAGPTGTFRVGPKLYVALLWHQHQPVYKDTSRVDPRGSYVQPWVRLHGYRDYLGMAMLAAAHPHVHLTINLTPSLIWQLEDHVERGATDRALEMARKHPSKLSSRERDALLASFFDANTAQQIAPHPRYAELRAMRVAGQPFSDQDIRDLAVWFQLAWFAQELREGEVQLLTGDRVSVRRLVAKGRDFDQADVDELFAEGDKVLRAILPMHRALQDAGQIEVSTTPFFHPILPLLVDTSRATIDRPGARHPRRFAHPEDAIAQVQSAVDQYRRVFRRRPRGMWPAEGAVSQNVIPAFASAKLRWIASDRGVLARSGEHGYQVDDPDVLCRPYRADERDSSISVFFRDTRLSDDIAFVYQSLDPDEAASRFVTQLKERFANRLRGGDDRVLTIVVDGENAWGSYRDDGRPFLHALYRALEADADIDTVTFSEYIEGNKSRDLYAHPTPEQTRVHNLYTGSWIDEQGSAPGVDLGTWIGEPEENIAWDLLGDTRAFLDRIGATPETHPRAFEALYMAEGSDWFWWFGEDQDSGRDSEFDDLFRMHLRNVYLATGHEPPPRLSREIVPHATSWLYGSLGGWARPGDRIVVHTRCPGRLRFLAPGQGGVREVELKPAGGVMASGSGQGAIYQARIEPFPPETRKVRFEFSCERAVCDCSERCRDPLDRELHFAAPGSGEGDAE